MHVICVSQNAAVIHTLLKYLYIVGQVLKAAGHSLRHHGKLSQQKIVAQWQVLSTLR